MKPCLQYFMRYESDKITCGKNDHFYGHASTIKTAKQYIRKCRKELAQDNPRNFRIYDSFAEVDPETNHVPCVYQED